MNDYPIIFCTDMVRAYLEDKKTQTRRTAGLERVNIHPDDWELRHTNNTKTHFLAFFQHKQTGERVICKCPYGKAGSALWVRETWATAPNFDNIKPSDLPRNISIIKKANGVTGGKWRPSIHLPRDFARLFPELTKVRVERLQEITEADARAEGVEPFRMDWEHHVTFRFKGNFIKLWDSINAKRDYGWDTNPWVWPLEYKKGVNK